MARLYATLPVERIPPVGEHTLLVEVAGHMGEIRPGAWTFADVYSTKDTHTLRLAQFLCTLAQAIRQSVYIESVPSSSVGSHHDTFYDQHSLILFYRFYIFLPPAEDNSVGIGDAVMGIFARYAKEKAEEQNPKKRPRFTRPSAIIPITTFEEFSNTVNAMHTSVGAGISPLIDATETDISTIGASFLSAFDIRRWVSYDAVHDRWAGRMPKWGFAIDAAQFIDAYAPSPLLARVRVIPPHYPTHSLVQLVLPHIDVDGAAMDTSSSSSAADPFSFHVEGNEIYTDQVRVPIDESDMNAIIFPTMVHQERCARALLAGATNRRSTFEACMQSTDRILAAQRGKNGIPTAYTDAYIAAKEYEVKRNMDPRFRAQCSKTIETGGSFLADVIIKLVDVFNRTGLASDAGICISIYCAATAAGVALFDIMRPHIIMTGRYGGGKSRRFNAVLHLLAPGLYSVVDSSTAKQDRQGGHAIPGTETRVGENRDHLRLKYHDEVGHMLQNPDKVCIVYSLKWSVCVCALLITCTTSRCTRGQKRMCRVRWSTRSAPGASPTIPPTLWCSRMGQSGACKCVYRRRVRQR
jgi:hypothetical protein